MIDNYNQYIIYYCRDCDRSDQSPLLSLDCTNCKKKMNDIGWAVARMREDS